MMSVVGTFLGKHIASNFWKILKEAIDKNTIAVFPGRFQPFHPGHYNSYLELVKKFGKDNVFIVTSNKIGEESPLTFDEKKKIITSMFDVPEDKIVKVQNVYKPIELLNKFPPSTTIVYGVGQKDAERLSHGKYFQPYENGKTAPYKDNGFVEIVPSSMSATSIRNVLNSNLSMEKKKKYLDKIYGKDTSIIFKELNDTMKNHSKLYKSLDPNQKIKNPLTGREILIRTALSYPPEHPAHISVKKMLGEGGAFGHLDHPYEDMNLTFGQAKEMLSRIFSNSLNTEDEVTEKTDGQNIMFTITSKGEIMFARNKTQLKNPIPGDQLSQMFPGKENIQKAFDSAAKDLVTAIQTVGKYNNTLSDFFKPGEFMSVEVFNPDTTNVIPYNKNLLIFHGTVDDNGIFNRAKAKEFSDEIRKANAHEQKTYGMESARSISFSQNELDAYKFKGELYIQTLDAFQKNENLSDSDTLLSYYLKRALNRIEELERYFDISVSQSSKEALAQRIMGNKSTSMTVLKSDKDAYLLAKEIDGNSTYKKEVMMPIERLFLKAGADAIKQTINIYLANNPKAIEDLTTQLKSAISNITAAGNNGDVELLERELEKLNDIGWNNIVPTEGLVFMYGGKPYKLTGTFAPLNQILGIQKYKRSGASKEPTQGKKQKLSDYLNDTIKNPETDNNILVKTALSYDPSHPVRKSAVQYLKTKMRG